MTGPYRSRQADRDGIDYKSRMSDAATRGFDRRARERDAAEARREAEALPYLRRAAKELERLFEYNAYNHGFTGASVRELADGLGTTEDIAIGSVKLLGLYFRYSPSAGEYYVALEPQYSID